MTEHCNGNSGAHVQGGSLRQLDLEDQSLLFLSLSSFFLFSPPCFSSACFLLLLQTSIQEEAKPSGQDYAKINVK